MKKILLVFMMLCVCNTSSAQLGIQEQTKEDTIVALVTNAFNLSKYNDTYMLCVNSTATSLGLNKVPEFVIINLGKGRDNAIQSITLLLNMCKGNTIKGTTITDHEGKSFSVSSSIYPEHPLSRFITIETGEFMRSCMITEDVLQMLLYKLNKE